MTLAERLSAARSGRAVGPVEERTILRLSGKDVPSFLHRMSTQEVGKLGAGASAYLAFLEVKGHLVSDALLGVREQDSLLLAPAEAGGVLLPHLRKYLLASKVAVEELSAAWRCLPVLGPAAAEAPGREGAGAAIPDPRRGAPAVDLLLPAAEAEAARARLLAAGAADLSAADLEVLRLEAGLPRFAADMDGTRLAVEAGLAAAGAAVSFEKGCYLGQEVVLRATFRGQVQRGLCLLELPASAGAGAVLRAGDQEVGRVTSAADTPAGHLGLGYLKRAHWGAGTRLATDGGEAVVRRALVEERG